MRSPPPSPDAIPNPSKLLDRVRRECRRRGYSLHTERAYRRWIVQYVHHHGTRPPKPLYAPIEVLIGTLY